MPPGKLSAGAFSARAGINRSAAINISAMPCRHSAFSARARGSTDRRTASLDCCAAFSARAGINRQGAALGSLRSAGVLRTRGDQPIPQPDRRALQSEAKGVPPHARGSTARYHAEKANRPRSTRSPARAGINRLRKMDIKTVKCVLRTRGDQPAMLWASCIRRGQGVLRTRAGINRPRRSPARQMALAFSARAGINRGC